MQRHAHFTRTVLGPFPWWRRPFSGRRERETDTATAPKPQPATQGTEAQALATWGAPLGRAQQRTHLASHGRPHLEAGGAAGLPSLGLGTSGALGAVMLQSVGSRWAGPARSGPQEERPSWPPQGRRGRLCVRAQGAWPAGEDSPGHGPAGGAVVGAEATLRSWGLHTPGRVWGPLPRAPAAVFPWLLFLGQHVVKTGEFPKLYRKHHKRHLFQRVLKFQERGYV